MSAMNSFRPVPNAGDWSGYVEIIDKTTGSAWDLTSILVEMETVDQSGCRRLYGATSDGTLVVAGDGFEFLFPVAQMRSLCAGSYTVNIRGTDSNSGAAHELAIVNLPIIEGGYR